MNAKPTDLESVNCSKATDATKALSYAGLEKQQLHNHEDDAQILDVQIVTEIRPPHIQSGKKSTHYIRVDFERKTVTSDFWTGHTNFFGWDIESAGDRFVVSGISFAGSMVSFVAIGRTATGIRKLAEKIDKGEEFPHIDYRFNIELDTRENKVTFSGGHDKFPSYYIQVEETKVYDHGQLETFLTGLQGTNGFTVGKQVKSY